MSLKDKLKIAIELRGRMSNTELYDLCRLEGYKLSNAERRLRELMKSDPTIRAERDAKGIIHAYRFQKPLINSGLTANEFLRRFPSKEVVKELTLF